MLPARTLTIIAIACLSIAPASVWATFIKVSGVVTDHFTGEALPGTFIRLYKNGHVVKSGYTGEKGKYDFMLDMDADYVVRFTAPDRATKSFVVDTYGLPKRSADLAFELIVEMKMLSMLNSVDLSFFDLPVGMAKFDPGTGNMEWNAHYAAHIKLDIKRVMAKYERSWNQQNELVERRY